MPFEKGKSGNPKGRPKTGESFTELWNKYSKYGKENGEAFFKVIDKHIENGNTQIAVDIMNRLFGKPKESIELDTGDNINSFAEWVKSVAESPKT